ncbi:AsmA-like C-terminal region-containing protein [Nitrospirillum sp. BR 11752]|uniref:YhdP family protein n=1 Tax=Nitrospirillum sp. BR 11752 TaxID=3104293 RepID=UPI002EB748F2|nr:AsmA-like C-terminal region-containing protein [Nitrospirillum sp. BR 11752]
MGLRVPGRRPPEVPDPLPKAPRPPRKRRGVVGHTALVILELVAGLLLVVLLTAGLLSWRLSRGPMPISWFAPYLEQAVNEGGTVHISVHKVALAKAAKGATVEIMADDVVLTGTGGATVATLPEFRIALSVPALLHGRLAPTRIVLVRPRLNAIREVDGRFRLALLSDDDTDDGNDFMADLIAALKRPPDPLEPLGALTKLVVSEARLSVDNRQLGLVWSAPRADVVLTRDRQGITGNAQLMVDLGGHMTQLAADLGYRLADGTISAVGHFSGVSPADLAHVTRASDGVLAAVGGIDMPLAGTITLELAADFSPRIFDVALSGTAGTVTLPGRLKAPLAVANLDLQARLEPEGLTLNHLNLTLPATSGTAPNGAIPGSTIALTGKAAKRDDGSYRVGLNAEVKAVPLNALDALWPLDALPKPRAWILQNLSDGAFDKVAFTLEGSAPAGLSDLVPTRMAATFAFSGATVNYMDGLPKVKDVGGTATFDGGHLGIELTQGRLLDLALGTSRLDITGLDKTAQKMEMTLPVSGPISSALTVIDTPPLGYAKKVGLVPSAVAGTADMTLRFDFPLVATLKMDQVKLGVQAHLKSVAADNIVADIKASEGDLTLVLDNKGMDTNGTARLNGMPARILWRENFPEEAPIGTRVALQATATDRDRQLFHLDFPDWVRGPMGVSMVYTRDAQHAESILADLDLTRSALAVALMDWRKVPGTPASAHVEVGFDQGRPLHITRFQLKSDGMEASGSLDLKHDFSIRHIAVDRYRQGRTDAAMTVDMDDAGGMRIKAAGPSLDARPFRRSASGGGNGGGGGNAGGSPRAPTEAELKALDARPPLDIDFNFDKVVTANGGREIGASKGQFARRGRSWRSVALDSRVGKDNAGHLSLRYVPDGNAMALTITSDDAGAALQQLDVLDHLRGGKLVVKGHSLPGDPHEVVDGTLDVTDYQVVEAPVMARLLSAASFQGFSDFMSGAPITFSKLEGGFHWTETGVTFHDVRTSGAAIGLTMEGEINLSKSMADLQGTIVPFSTLNKLLGAIPIVGDLLTGGEGQGLLSATYRVKGPLDDLDVSVNPLAVLAPGFLRNLFFLSPTDEDGKPEAKPAPRKGSGKAGGASSGGEGPK